MFANTQMMGTDMGFPDVCLTPTPVPTPIPYPNIAMGPMGVPAAYTILFSCAPAHNMSTTVTLTNGDNAGVNMGVASGTEMGPEKPITAAFTVLLSGMPATRMTMSSIGNSTNSPTNVRLAPSQTSILILAP